MEMEMNTLSDLDTIVLAAFSCITSDDCRSWISSIIELVESICRDSVDTQYNYANTNFSKSKTAVL